MALTPNSDLKLLKCPIESDNKNQLTFANATEQYNYFNSLEKIEGEGFTYLRKENVIRFNAHIDSIIGYNYVMYRNTNYSNKWFYAFIKRMEYVSNTVTFIYIETDTYQTWMFDLNFLKSFVEREHVSNDTIGLHTVPEGLETGEYVCNESTDVFRTGILGSTLCIMVSDVPDSIYSQLDLSFSVNNSIFSGCFVFAAEPTGDEVYMKNFLKILDKDSKGDAVVSIFYVPNDLIPSTINYEDYSVDGIHAHMGLIPPIFGSTLMQTSTAFTVPSTLNGYTPKNNKLKTWPYSYFYLTNNVGSDIDFKYEDFINNSVQFKTFGAITPGCSIRCVPLNYKKLADDLTSNYEANSYNSGITVAKYPICSWTNDSYTNWLTENGLNLNITGASSVTEIVAGAGMLVSGVGVTAGAGLVAAGIGGITQTLTQVNQHSYVPNQAKGNTASGDVVFSHDKINITAYKMSIRNEYAKIIDDYFSMFGYKVNELKIPNLNSRSKWNYIKTIDINIVADIPQDDLQKIKDMFNSGITLWHDPSHYLDYSQTNSIV